MLARIPRIPQKLAGSAPAAGVAADGKVHDAGGDGRSRAAGRAAGKAPGALTFTGAP